MTNPNPIQSRLCGRWMMGVVALWLLLCMAGCGTLPNGRGWGQDAIYPVNLKRFPQAVKNALLDPMTYIPAAGALVCAIDDVDEHISDWASTHHPVFGSKQRARDASDYLRDTLTVSALGTALITPSGNETGEWMLSKAKGIGVEAVAWQSSWLVTEGLKAATNRTRPDKSNDDSFPSGHATSAFSAATLANRNLDAINMQKGWRTAFKATNIALATSVAWARVEGQKHFPSDVLVGAALGHFFTAVIHDTFIGLGDNSTFSLYLEPARDGGKVMLSWGF